MMTSDLRFGWNPHLDIPAALARLPPQKATSYVVQVSMVDSTPDVSELPSIVPLLADIGRPYTQVGTDVVVDLPTIMCLINEYDFFSGFDEIWLCREIPRMGKPRDLRITSDTRLDSQPPGRLAEWMLESSCRAGLGDGVGLNFVTFEPALATLWRLCEP
jgi:hypothetical protein